MSSSLNRRDFLALGGAALTTATAPPTPAYFAIKGFEVVASPCDKTDVALAQLELVYWIRKNAERADFSKTISPRMKGMFATSWMDAGKFIRSYYSTEDNDAKNTTDTFKALFAETRKNNAPKIVGG